MKRLHLVLGRRAGHLPHLDRLTRLARPINPAVPEDEHSLTTRLAHLFGLDTGALPALLHAADGLADDQRTWYRADPVHLLAGLHSVTLFDRLGLNADDSQALIDTLNQHFGDEIRFHAPHPERWYAGLRTALEFEAPPTDAIAGGPLALDRVSGPDARPLQRLAMEIQMLLHEHPVNNARETRNLPTANALWLWGGTPGHAPAADYDQVYANDFISQTLARAAGLRHTALPDVLDPSSLPDNSLIVLTEATPELDERCLAPLLSALRRRRIGELTLQQPGAPMHRLDGWHALAFWR
jgi:hypothetical protein